MLNGLAPPARTATLALLLEATADPKPGNVDRGHDHDDATLHHFVASALAVGPAVAGAAEGPLGAAIEDAATAGARHGGGNTQFGAAVLLAPLVAGAATDDLPEGARDAVAAATPADAAAFCRAFDQLDVHVPPVEEVDAAVADLDVTDPATRDRVVEEGIGLDAVMRRSAPVDDVAREWTEGFPRSFDAADRLERRHDPDRVDATERAVAATYLDLLAEEPDTHVAKLHGDDVAREVRDRAAAIGGGDASAEDAAALDAALVDRGVNPGTTADIVAAGLFVALHRDGGFRV